MKKLYTFLFLLIATSCIAYGANITFKVDMSSVVPASEIVIAGSFNDFDGDENEDNPGLPQWSDSGLILGDEGNNIYSITLDLVDGDYQFKFLNGIGGWETIVGDCTTEGNRTITVAGENMEVGPVCFGTCESECTSAPLSVTFRVDMSNEFVSGDGVTVTGNFASLVGFSDWTPGQIFLNDDDGDDIYSVTFDNVPPGTYQYKYINGIGWPDAENVPTECNAAGNREFTVSGDNTIVLGNVYGSCDPIKSNVTFIVDMTNETVNGDVSVTGDFASLAGFSDWTPGQIVMNPIGGSSIYTYTVQLPAGNYQYKFINGESWEGVPPGCASGGNRQLTVGEVIDVQAGPICYASCVAECPDITPINVTFRMSFGEDDIPAASGLFVAGSFQDPAWQKNELELTDGDGDGIYTVTVPNMFQYQYEFKFFNGTNGDPTSDEFAETFDFATGGCGASNPFGSNRILNLEGVTEDTQTDIYEFNSCELLNVGITEVFEQRINVYPNPVQEVINIDFDATTSENLNISLMDITGKLVYQKAGVKGTGVQIQRNDLPSGTYLLNLSSDNVIIATQKVLLD